MNAEWSELNRLTKRQEAFYHKCAVNAGITDAKFWILYAVCQSGGSLSQSAICEDWYFSKQTVNSAVTGLIQQDRVLSMEFAEGSRKQKELHLTHKGEAFCNAYIRPVLKAECSAISELPPEQRRVFLDAQEKIIGKLEKELL